MVNGVWGLLPEDLTCCRKDEDAEIIGVNGLEDGVQCCVMSFESTVQERESLYFLM